MTRALLLVALLGACSFQHAVGGDAGTSGEGGPGAERMDWLDGFASRKPIDLAGKASQLDDFVVAIVEAADADLANSADVAFTAADGTTLLATERVAFDKTTGALEAWVRTTLVAGAPTRIYLYYGGSTTATRPPEVWSPATFAGAWHMTGTAGTTDSVHGNNAVASGSAPGSATGLAGLARSYDGTTQALAVPDPADGSLDFGTNSFGYAVWVDVTQSAGGYDMPLSKGGFSSLDPGYDLELGTNNWNFSLSDGTGGNSFYVTLEPESAGLGAWHQLAVVVDRTASNVTGYIDGVAQPPVAITLGAFDNTHPLYLGGDTYRFAGLLDEVRVYATAPSADWLAAEHANLADAAHFVHVGAAELR